MKDKKEKNKTTIAIAILTVLLLAAVVYIGVDAYNKSKTQKENEIFVSGTQLGAQNTIQYLFQQGAKCEPTPIFIQNQTLTMYPLECVYQTALTCQAMPITIGEKTVNMIAVECLQQQQEAQQQ